ncbi:HD domain-containing phosphohydrolase [Polynucleobacter sp. AP-Kolm-20A-A1]|uniref:HD domain-containing phosphohydrolase n=1 Tax=Polynucleobacter sp. AP-Kolm-20A-A1 TaxID=2081041 RepID=UPI001BFE42B5|nr:HD domain-containing phosphohydrolase [Polynucleobacter sp. AP-Kolm-20A-A1]QWE19981.1 HD domain-containing protein [Polynucleobacter sp. AP-Kolm-20A-A1]
MQLANQTFYFSSLVILIGLLAGSLSRHDSAAANKQLFYWPLSLFLLAVSMACFFIGSWGGKAVLAIANLSLVGGVICIGILFRSWRGQANKSTLVISAVAFVVSSIAYFYFLATGTTADRIYLMNGILALASFWQVIELALLVRKRVKAYQIKILMVIELVEILVRVMRSIYLRFYADSNLGSLYQEDAIGFSLRVVSILLLLMVCVIITNYYLESLWREHRSNARAIESGMLQSLNALSMVRDNETGNHILRTQQYVKRLAESLRDLGHYVDDLSDRAIEHMVHAAPLHDIGKVGIPDNILKKEGSLDAEEWAVMQTHAALGERVLRAAKLEETKSAKVLDVAIDIAGSHHENWDGSGYPNGLKGQDIPLAARIMSLADMYDALVSERVYKKKWSHEEACQEIIQNKGKRFDPAVVDAFINEQDYFSEIASRYGDA